MNSQTKTLLIIGIILVAVGLVSIPSPYSLQWLATIGIVVLIIAFFTHRGYKKEQQRTRRLMGEEE